MKRQIILLLSVVVLASFVIINGCGKDNPVYSGNGGGITKLNANGTIVPTDHSNASGNMFISDQNGNPISGITSSNVSATLKWGSLDNPVDSATGIITVSSNSQQGKNVAGAITMDLSGSMNPPISPQVTCMKNGVLSYINSMKPNDLTEIIKFSSDIEVVQQFTSDKILLKTADTSVWAGEGGATALYQSIYQGTNDVALQPPALIRSVVAFTDGGENNSVVSRQTMISNALSNGIPIYTVFFFVDTLNSYYHDMKNIADTTGGFNFWVEPDSCSNLARIYQTISGQLLGSYNLSVNWQGNLPPMGTVVRATITINYSGLKSSFTKSYVIP